MPSFLHEAMLMLFDESPSLALFLLRYVFHIKLPRFTTITDETREIRGLSPHPYHADRVLALRDRHGRARLVLVLEAQIRSRRAKAGRWPLYYSHLSVRYECNVLLLVIAPSPSVAAWARRPIALGQPGSVFVPLAIGPEELAALEGHPGASTVPELAVLSALVHARSSRALEVASAALGAVAVVDEERRNAYYNVILSTQSAPHRQRLEEMMEVKDWELKGAWAKKYYKKGIRAGKLEGRAEGKAEGWAEAVVEQLEDRGVVVSDEDRARVLACRDLDLLRSWLRRSHRVATVAELLD